MMRGQRPLIIFPVGNIPGLSFGPPRSSGLYLDIAEQKYKVPTAPPLFFNAALSGPNPQLPLTAIRNTYFIMDFTALFPPWLDAFLIAPFRWPSSPMSGMMVGCSLLSFYCILIGEMVGGGLYMFHNRYYQGMQDNVLRYHNLSVEALHAGNKEAYLAANKMAQEHFGKSFFAHNSIGVTTLLPVPFALAWLSERFEGIPLVHIPGTDLVGGYVFIFLSLYIVLRITFSRIKKHLPLFRIVEQHKANARKARGMARSMFQPPSSDKDATPDAGPQAPEK